MIISLYVVFILAIVIILIATLMLIKHHNSIKLEITKHRESIELTQILNKKQNKPIIELIILTIGVVLLIMTTTLFITAPKHGMEKENIKITNFYDVLMNTLNTPTQSTVNAEDVKPGDIIMYYRFDCPDCHAIYKDLSKELQDVSDVYWISSRSTTGEKLLKEYPVEEVPSAIYIRNNTLSGSAKYSKFILYAHDKDENVILNMDEKYGLPRLLKLKENNK